MIAAMNAPARKADRQSRILDAALTVFASCGYSGASMAAIAAAAGVSKPTLYVYFGSKDLLFAALMHSRRDSMLEAFAHPSTLGMVQDLHRFACDYAATVMHPDFLSLARLIIAEAHRLAQVGRAYQAAGPDRVLHGMMDYLIAQRAAGHLVFDDAELAAQDLWALILSAPRNLALHVPDAAPSQAQIARYRNNGLRVFLRAYSARPEADLAALAKIIAAS